MSTVLIDGSFKPAATPAQDPAPVDLKALQGLFAGRAERHDRDGSFPHDNFADLHRQGLLALAAPKAFGGGGADLGALAEVVDAVSYADPSTGLVLSMQYLFSDLMGRGRGWSPDLLARFYAEVVEDGALINGLRVEPDLGTPARGGLPAANVRKVADGWVLNGRKIYSTGAPGLTWMTVWGRTDEADPRIGSFLVRRDMPGVRIEETWDHLGMRATGSHELVFENVALPDEHISTLVKPQDQGAMLDGTFAVRNAVLIATVYNAVARAARDWLVEWLQNRVPSNLGAPLSSLPRMQETVGKIETLLYANRVLLDDAINDPRFQDAGTVKHLVTTNAVAAVEQAVEVTGNPGLARGNPLERHLRNVLCGRVHTPQSDMVLQGLGRAAFAAGAAA